MTAFTMIFVALVMLGCNMTVIPATMTPTPQPSPTPTSAPPDGWNRVGDGLQQRTLTMPDNALAQFIAVRMDPAQYEFRVHYSPGEPRRLNDWLEQLPDAELIVNAGFFDPENRALGLLIADGTRYGQPYTNRGGTFGVLNEQPVIRSNVQQPYSGEAYSQAVQAFPMLVQSGQAAYNNASETQPARRSVIGIDATGHVIVMITPVFGPGLYPMSQYLASSDIQLADAFNLDGGGSTMLAVRSSGLAIASFDPVPAVIAAYRR